MSAQRAIIRTAACEILKGRTLAGDNVFPSRVQAMWEEWEMPAIVVYAASEAISLQSEAPRQYRRDLELRLEVMASGRDAEDVIDRIGDEIERAIGRSNRLTYAKESQCAEITLSSEQLEYRQDGENKIAALMIVYSVIYFTFEPDEYDLEPIDDLKTVHTEYSLDGDQVLADRAADDIGDLQQ